MGDHPLTGTTPPPPDYALARDYTKSYLQEYMYSNSSAFGRAMFVSGSCCWFIMITSVCFRSPSFSYHKNGRGKADSKNEND